MGSRPSSSAMTPSVTANAAQKEPRPHAPEQGVRSSDTV